MNEITRLNKINDLKEKTLQKQSFFKTGEKLKTLGDETRRDTEVRP